MDELPLSILQLNILGIWAFDVWVLFDDHYLMKIHYVHTPKS